MASWPNNIPLINYGWPPPVPRPPYPAPFVPQAWIPAPLIPPPPPPMPGPAMTFHPAKSNPMNTKSRNRSRNTRYDNRRIHKGRVRKRALPEPQVLPPLPPTGPKMLHENDTFLEAALRTAKETWAKEAEDAQKCQIVDALNRDFRMAKKDGTIRSRRRLHPLQQRAWRAQKAKYEAQAIERKDRQPGDIVVDGVEYRQPGDIVVNGVKYRPADPSQGPGESEMVDLSRLQ